MAGAIEVSFFQHSPSHHAPPLCPFCPAPPGGQAAKEAKEAKEAEETEEVEVFYTNSSLLDLGCP